MRNLIVTKEKDFSHLDVETVISWHFKHYYYSGNILFSISLICNHLQIFEKYALNCLLCLITLCIYFQAYYSHLKKSKNVKLANIFNIISLPVNISFLLAWNVCYITITASSFMTTLKCSTYTINIVLQITLSLFVILALTYFNDYYFSFIVLIFEIGSTLNKNVFNIAHNSRCSISIVITTFTIICFFSSMIHNFSNRNREKYLEDLESTYYEKQNNV